MGPGNVIDCRAGQFGAGRGPTNRTVSGVEKSSVVRAANLQTYVSALHDVHAPVAFVFQRECAIDFHAEAAAVEGV